MTDIGFAPKEIIPQEVCRLEVISAERRIRTDRRLA